MKKMNDYCYALNEGEILNEDHPEWPLFVLTICGSKVESLKISKRVMCTLKHLPLRLQIFYENDTVKCIEMRGGRDPSIFRNNKILFEGLIQAEEIKKIFEKLLKGDNMLEFATPKGHNDIRIEIEDFINLFNEGKAVLVDVRMPFEKKVWNLPFAIDMNPESIKEKYEELPKDKLIVCACPGISRSPFVVEFLKEKGFEAKYLQGGLLKLMERLKGGKAKDLKID